MPRGGSWGGGCLPVTQDGWNLRLSTNCITGMSERFSEVQGVRGAGKDTRTRAASDTTPATRRCKGSAVDLLAFLESLRRPPVIRTTGELPARRRLLSVRYL